MTAPAAPSPSPAPFVVELPEFAGPLDLLLNLIREEKVDIYDIPIARVARQFLERVHAMGLNEAADYLELAARLLRIKAQMLLPRHEGEDGWEDPRAELVRRLLEYQQMREVVDLLERLGDDRRQRFQRGFLPTAPEPPAAPLALSLAELLGAVDRVMRVLVRPGVHEVVPRALDVQGAIARVREVLARVRRARWEDIVRLDAEPWEVLSALLALLELAKLGELKLAQAVAFGTLEIAVDEPGQAA
jgi:segregation and condensation protein A